MYNFDDDPDAKFVLAELYSSVDDEETVEFKFDFLPRLRLFCGRFLRIPSPVRRAAGRAWDRWLSIRYPNIPSDIPF